MGSSEHRPPRATVWNALLMGVRNGRPSVRIPLLYAQSRKSMAYRCSQVHHREKPNNTAAADANGGRRQHRSNTSNYYSLMILAESAIGNTLEPISRVPPIHCPGHNVLPHVVRQWVVSFSWRW